MRGPGRVGGTGVRAVGVDHEAAFAGLPIGKKMAAIIKALEADNDALLHRKP